MVIVKKSLTIQIRFKSAILLLLAGFVIAGCQSVEVTSTDQTTVVTETDLIGVYLLAERLGLKVTETADTHVTLKNSTNTILIFTHTGGKFYVNGKPIGLVGSIERIEGVIFVPESIVPQIRAAMRTTPPLRYRADLSGCVVIDPGHGGEDTGAVSSDGSYEKTVNLQVARKVGYMLRQHGLDVIMTRTNDRFIELDSRAEIANRNNAKLFVSIHADSAYNRSARGFTIYVARSASRRSHSAARTIAQSMKATGLSSRGVRKADYRVLVATKCPAVLVELGYLSNSWDARLLTNNRFQNSLAQAITKGICGAISAF